MKHIILLIPLLLSFGAARAQETLAQEISYEYLDKLVEIAKTNYLRVKMYDSRIEIGNFVNMGSILQKHAVVKQARVEVKVNEYEKQAFELNLVADVKKRYFTYIQHLAILRN